MILISEIKKKGGFDHVSTVYTRSRNDCVADSGV